ncbi:uncharacterized protein OCT59_020962 [Rhizophagus irregularis]|uniref:uncharacterized protein n=1 Tax=Rhizophagus irregularis TaxID=588596 RepID=UPI00333471A9|nr:hypothetical protein OCT59_020962 [Rhizophagus irregularis]
MSSQDDITCKNCGELYTDIHHKWCKPCLINGLKQNFVNWTSGNEEIDNFIQITQLKIDNLEDTIVEWIPYDQFDNIKEIGKGEFATVYLAKWKDGPLLYQYERIPYKEVALKCLHNSQNITNEFLNEVNAYSIGINNNILRIYGISQNPDTNNYIIVLEYANGGNLNNYNNNIIRNYNWISKLSVLSGIVQGLNKIHEKRLVHRDFHTGNILVSFRDNATGDAESDIYISDMRLCGEVSNIGKTKIYGVMPFVAPEVLRGEPYNQAADVYSFDPYKRPSVIEIKKLVKDSLRDDDDEIKKQIEEAEEYRKTNFLSTGISQSIHPQAYYTSRLLNQFTKELSKHDDTYNISAEIIDFTE